MMALFKNDEILSSGMSLVVLTGRQYKNRDAVVAAAVVSELLAVAVLVLVVSILFRIDSCLFEVVVVSSVVEVMGDGNGNGSVLLAVVKIVFVVLSVDELLFVPPTIG